MVDVKLSVGAYAFIFNEGDVKKVESNIESSAEQQKVSSTAPLSARIYDYDGCTKIIVIRGKLTDASTTRVSGYSILTIAQQKYWLESLANGVQGQITFESNYESLSAISSASATAPYLASFSTTKCKISNMKFDEVEGLPNQLEFSISLMVGI
jgi:hypothetical protein